MKQLTLRGFDKELERAIRSEAEAYGISLNQAVLRLARRGAGLERQTPSSGKIGSSLDRFIGTWTDEEAREMKEAIRIFECIDEDFWR